MSATIAGLLEHSKALAEARMAEIHAEHGMSRDWWNYYELSRKLTPIVHLAARTEKLKVSEQLRGLPSDVVSTGRLHSLVRDGETVWQLQCPGCGEWADIDDDQFHGRVSVFHDKEDGGCGFHETRDWRTSAVIV